MSLICVCICVTTSPARTKQGTFPSLARRFHCSLFQSDWTIHQQCVSSRFAPHLLQCLLLSVFFIGYSGRYVIASLCGFNLHFLNDKGNWSPLFMLIGLLDIFFCETPVQVFPPHFSIWFYVFNLLICRSSLFQINEHSVTHK